MERTYCRRLGFRFKVCRVGAGAARTYFGLFLKGLFYRYVGFCV